MGTEGLSKLEYQPALPIANGKLAMWFFVSTEVMFFTALVGAYIVLRLGTPENKWPSADQVDLSFSTGVLSLVVLCCSSFTMAGASINARLRRQHSSRVWLAATIVLGLAFLGLTGCDYAAKYSRGLVPGFAESKLHDAANLDFLDAVKRSVEQQLRSVTENPQRENLASPPIKKSTDWVTSDGLNHAQRLQLIASGLVSWTEKKVGRSDDRLMQQRSLQGLAYQIYPRGFDQQQGQKIATFLVDEDVETVAVLEEVAISLSRCEMELRAVQVKIKASAAEDDGRPPPGSVSSDGTAGGDDALGRLKQLAGQLTGEITRLTVERDTLKNRKRAAEFFLPVGEGLNQRFGMTLPMVIPGGNAWANLFFLSTAAHGVHVVVGSMVLGVMLIRGLIVKRRPSEEDAAGDDRGLENAGLYWQFVVAMGGVLFVLIYLVE